ncbi:MAG: hypothetical protein U0271_04670 [Polyangiaceae bacterium]
MATFSIEAVLADLDDDGPRRVLADRLEAEGDPRGELITVECELARLGYASRPPSWDWIGDALIDPESVDASYVRKLRLRENALLKQLAAQIFAGLGDVTFERGFPASLRFDARGADARGRFEALVAAAPTLQTLELTVGPSAEDAAHFFASSAFACIRELRVGSQAIAGLVQSAELRSLRRLSTHGDVDVLDALLGWARLPHLARLELNPRPIGEEGLAALLAACGPLDELQLRGAAIGREGAALLAREPKLQNLRVLALLGNKLGDDGVARLAGSPNLTRLRALDLRKNKVGVKGAAALGAAFPELRTLDLTGNTLGRAGLEALCNAGGLGKLRELCLQQTGLDGAALGSLAAAEFLGRVRVLSLRSNKLSDAGAALLAASPHGANLELINLNNNDLTEDGKRLLTASRALPRARIVCK